MPSATTADSSDSIAPNSVNDTAAGKTCCSFSSEKSGNCGCGRPDGMPPNWLEMVAIGKLNTAQAPDASATATSIAGQRGCHRRSATMARIVPAATAAALGETVPRTPHSANSFCSNGPGSCGKFRPKSGFIWLAKMITAMPPVKPTVTGKGMNLMKLPSRSIPRAASITPERNVASITPDMPCCAAVAETNTIKAPAGPPI